MGVKNKSILVMVSLIFSGCSALPQASADTAVQPSVSHIMSFNVNHEVQAEVTLEETRIMVQTNSFQPVQVSSVNLPLLRQWNRIYFKISDYDWDGMNDLAILQSVGRVGTQRCYAIHRYNPVTGMFRRKKSFDRCGI